MERSNKPLLAIKTLFSFLLTSFLAYLINKKHPAYAAHTNIKDYYLLFSLSVHTLAYFWLIYRKREPQKATQVEKKLFSKIPYSSFFIVLFSVFIFGIVIVYLVAR